MQSPIPILKDTKNTFLFLQYMRERRYNNNLSGVCVRLQKYITTLSYQDRQQYTMQ